MNIFITGATGYIGFNVAQALRRSGHNIWGLTRSEEKAKMLKKNEITPVIGDMSDPSGYLTVAQNCSVLIHAASDMEHDTVELDKKTVRNLINVGENGSWPKTFIYTSGCWVHGDTHGKLVDETTPLEPAKMVAWRPDVEQMVLNAENVKGLVVRPGCVYGKRGGLTGLWFGPATKGDDFNVVGDGSNHWTMIHVDDLADAYVRIAESGLTGEVFDISDRSRSSVSDMVHSVAKTTGYKKEINFLSKEEASKIFGGMAETLALDQHVDGGKATRLLGWHPKFNGFLDNVETYYKAWLANQ